jgi:hypothetical protein
MKKLLMAAAVTALSTTAVADDYRFQVKADYFNDEISKNADLTTYALGGNFYFTPVDDSSGPKAEAAFLERASDVHVGFGRTNIKIDELDFTSKVDEDGDVWALGGRYVADSLIVELDYASTEVGKVDTEALALAVGFYLSDASAIKLSYLRTELDDIDTDVDVWSLGYKHLFNNTFNLEADLTYADPKYGEKAYGLTGALDYYINDNFSIGGVLGYITSDDDFSEAAVYGINAEYFFSTNFALNAGYDVSSPDKGDDNKVWSIGLTGRF